MADKIALAKADALSGKGLDSDAIVEYEKFIARFPSSPLRRDAEFRLAESFASAGRTDEAVNAYLGLADINPPHPRQEEALLKAGLLLTGEKKYGRAQSVYDRIVFDAKDGGLAGRAQYEKGRTFLLSGDLSQAQTHFERVIQRYKGSTEADRAIIGLGIINLEKGDMTSARGRFNEIIRKRTDEAGAEAQYYYGESLAREGNHREAVTQLLRVKYVYPSATDWIARSYLSLGECYEKLEETGKAREAYMMVLNTHKEDDLGKEAGERIKGIK
jgi:TolA-binding protein